MIEDANINVSDKGIEIAYRRFISDSAPGLIFILSIYLIYRFYKQSFLQSIPIQSIPVEDKIPIFILLFLISTPLGLALNAVSYLFLDLLVHKFEEKIFLKALYYGKKDNYKTKDTSFFSKVRAWLISHIFYFFVFSWNEIPGKDDEKLRKFITQRYNIDWAKTAKIEKPDESIKVTDGDNFLSLTLCDEDNIVYLEIDDGRTEDFIVKSENHEPKIFGCWLIFKFLAYLLKTTAVNEFLWNLCEEKQCKHMNCKDDCKDRDKIWKKDVKNEKRFMRFTDCISAEEMYNQHRKYEVNHGHEVGVHVFFRNLAFISLIDIVFLFGIGHALPGFYYLFISFISFVIFSAFVSYYYRLGFLCDAYISSKKNELY